MTVKPAYTTWEPPSIKTFTIKNFTATQEEQKQLDVLLDKALAYTVYKNAVTDSLPNEAGKTIQSFLETMNITDSPPTEQSNVVYIDILDEYTDNEDTILHALSVLQERLQVGTNLNFLGVVGDGKTYGHLHTLKIEYGSDLNWLIPLPGDWHVLKNYQEILMKVYFEAGLKDAAKSIGYTEGVLNSIGSCGKFERTHLFLLRVWEALLDILRKLYK